MNCTIIWILRGYIGQYCSGAVFRNVQLNNFKALRRRSYHKLKLCIYLLSCEPLAVCDKCVRVI